MSPSDILAFIARTVESELETTHPVTMDARLAHDIELDSMGLTVVAVALENRFRIKLDEGDAGQLETVGDLVRLVIRRVEEKERAAC